VAHSAVVKRADMFSSPLDGPLRGHSRSLPAPWFCGRGSPRRPSLH